MSLGAGAIFSDEQSEHEDPEAPHVGVRGEPGGEGISMAGHHQLGPLWAPEPLGPHGGQIVHLVGKKVVFTIFPYSELVTFIDLVDTFHR